MADNDILDHDEGKANWIGHVNWMLLLLGPMAVGLAVLTNSYDSEGFQDLQVLLEYPAPWIMALVAVVYAIRWLVTRNPLCILLAALAVVFMLREFDIGWMRHSVYAAVALLAVCGVLWRKKIALPLRDWQHTSWLIATFAAYLLALLIGRRAFKSIPGEHPIHRSLEECAETAAHLIFVATSLVGSWRRQKTSAASDAHAAPEDRQDVPV